MLGADGCAYAIPIKAHQALRIDPDTETVRPFGPTGLNEYGGGFFAGDGFIYCVPWDATRMLRIDRAVTTCAVVAPTNIVSAPRTR